MGTPGPTITAAPSVDQLGPRGGPRATPRPHIAVTCRPFFPPDGRWQCAGLRPADEA